MIHELKVQTEQQIQQREITREVQKIVESSGISDGIALLFVPHTTAAVTINENADPDVVHDMLAQLDQMVPWQQPFYQHGEGNSAAHVKASMMGSSVQVIVQGGRLQLGTWQAIYFCEFDGPRARKVWVAGSA